VVLGLSFEERGWTDRITKESVLEWRERNGFGGWGWGGVGGGLGKFSLLNSTQVSSEMLGGV
jgi:hypothetical protein